MPLGPWTHFDPAQPNIEVRRGPDGRILMTVGPDRSIFVGYLRLPNGELFETRDISKEVVQAKLDEHLRRTL